MSQSQELTVEMVTASHDKALRDAGYTAVDYPNLGLEHVRKQFQTDWDTALAGFDTKYGKGQTDRVIGLLGVKRNYYR